MNSGKRDEKQHAPRLVPPVNKKENNEIPQPVLTCAKWLLDNPQVLEVWGMVSDLPEIRTPNASLTLDAGTWFLCRIAMPPRVGEGGAEDGAVDLTDTIISFVPKV